MIVTYWVHNQYQIGILISKSSPPISSTAPLISIIIPDQISSSEEVIKTVRLLCSKLFGSLFFEEHVPRRPPYMLMSDEEEEVLRDQVREHRRIGPTLNELRRRLVNLVVDRNQPRRPNTA